MDFETRSASDYPTPDLVTFLNRGFEQYAVPIQFNVSQFLTMVRKDGIDLASSRVLLADGHPSGIALIARRGWTSRLAAMGIALEMRGRGAGSWLMKELTLEARGRGDREMVLEVIEQNEAAVALYQRSGFEIVRRLVGFVRGAETHHPQAGVGYAFEAGSLEELDLRRAGALVSYFGLPDLPWQLTGETIAHMNPPARAYRHGQAYAVLSNPNMEHVVIWSLLVEPQARGKGLGDGMIRDITASHADRSWHVPALLPEELAKPFERNGFEREALSQWQMRLTLG